jgi:type IV secretory pathway VirD2 relaxase
METVARDLLTEDELKRGVRLEWVGVEHWDTDHPHMHVMMRARVEDRNLRLSSGYVSHGLRTRAREVATQHLGYRAERGVDLNEKRRIVMERRQQMGLDPHTGTPLHRQRDQSRGLGGGLE